MKNKSTLHVMCYGTSKDGDYAIQSFEGSKSIVLREDNPILQDCIKKASKNMKVNAVHVIWRLQIVDKKCAKKTQKNIPPKSKRGTIKRLKLQSFQK